MKLKEYLKNLKTFIKENPKALEMDAIYSKDDEGNGYSHVFYSPTLGKVDKDMEFKDYKTTNGDNNCVCIN